MSPAARLALIAATVKRKGGRIGIPESVKMRLDSAHKVKTQAREVVDTASTDDSILDEGANLDLISPMLAKATSGEFEGHARSDLILSARERAQASDDLWHYRHPPSLWLAIVNPQPAAQLTA